MLKGCRSYTPTPRAKMKMKYQGSVNGYINSMPQGIKCFIDHLTTLQSIIPSCITTLPKKNGTKRLIKKDYFFFKFRFFIYLLRSKHLQDRKRSLKVPKRIFNPQMKRRFGQFWASWYVLSTRSEVQSKFGAFYTTFCRTHDTLIHFWKIGIVCALELVMRSSVPNVKVNHRTLSKQANDSERRRNGTRSIER